MNLAQRISGIALALLLLAGCGAPAVTPTPTVEAGWTLYEKPADGFAIALPTTWKPWDSETTDAVLKAAREQNPQVAASWDNLTRELGSSFIKFVGMDFAPESTQIDLATAIIIAKWPPVEGSLNSYVETYTNLLEKSGKAIKPVSHWRVYFMPGEAEKVHFRRNVTALDGHTGTMAITQYLIIKGKDLYMITFSATTDQADKYAPVFEKIAKSFRWIK